MTIQKNRWVLLMVIPPRLSQCWKEGKGRQEGCSVAVAFKASVRARVRQPRFWCKATAFGASHRQRCHHLLKQVALCQPTAEQEPPTPLAEELQPATSIPFTATELNLEMPSKPAKKI